MNKSNLYLMSKNVFISKLFFLIGTYLNIILFYSNIIIIVFKFTTLIRKKVWYNTAVLTSK